MDIRVILFTGFYDSVAIHCATYRKDLQKDECTYHAGYPNKCLSCGRRAKFVCLMCDKVYQRSSSMETHIKVLHDKVREYRCPECEYKAKYKRVLERHVKHYHGPRYPKCQSCGDEFKNLARHQQGKKCFKESPMQLYYCIQCSQTFASLVRRDRHAEFCAEQ